MTTTDDDRSSLRGSQVDLEPEVDADDDYVYIPREMGIVRKGAIIGVTFAVIIVGLIGAGGWWALGQVRGTGIEGDEMTLSIPAGSTLTQVATLLEEQGIIENATVFRYYGKFRNLDSVQAGQYDGLYRGMSLDEVIERLKGTPLPEEFVDVNFPEGMTVAAMRAKMLNSFPQMSAAELDWAEVAAVAGTEQFATKYHLPGQPLEGFLFPATYRVQHSELGDEGALLLQMMRAFEREADDVGLDQATTKLAGAAGRDLTPYEVLIVASMIEKEAKIPEERPMVARVIYNRLLRNMRLEIDATLFYCPELRDAQELTGPDLRIDCPYNTRQVAGLPPTPIANPGRASLEAALNPAEGDWLYYVLTDADGHHFFTSDYDEFLRAMNQARDDGLL